MRESGDGLVVETHHTNLNGHQPGLVLSPAQVASALSRPLSHYLLHLAVDRLPALIITIPLSLLSPPLYLPMLSVFLLFRAATFGQHLYI